MWFLCRSCSFTQSCLGTGHNVHCFVVVVVVAKGGGRGEYMTNSVRELIKSTQALSYNVCLQAVSLTFIAACKRYSIVLPFVYVCVALIQSFLRASKSASV